MNLCKDCIDKSELCNNCKEKLDSGLLTKEEIDVLQALNEISKESPEIKNIDIKNIIDVGKIMIFVDYTDLKTMIGQNSKNVKLLADALGKYVRINSMPNSPKDFVKYLIGDIPIKRINHLYTENGNLYRIVINKFYKDKIKLSKQDFEKNMQKLTENDIELIFE